MKILCINGSPRKNGNTAKIIKALAETAESLGGKIKNICLGKLKYSGCIACMACKKKSDKCVIKDDISDVLKKITKSDLIVIGSPVYYGDVSSQMKALIDRTYSFLTSDYKSRLKPGKILVMILPQGDAETSHFSDIFNRYYDFFKWHGFKNGFCIRACGADNKDSVVVDSAIIEARELAKKILKAR